VSMYLALLPIFKTTNEFGRTWYRHLVTLSVYFSISYLDDTNMATVRVYEIGISLVPLLVS
jgi:hypothetical protein